MLGKLGPLDSRSSTEEKERELKKTVAKLVAAEEATESALSCHEWCETLNPES